MPTTATKVLCPLLHIGRGGWSMHLPSATRSHYGTTWRDHADEFTDDAVVVCTLTMSAEDVYVFAMSGPVLDVALPAGMMRDPFTNGLTPWDPRPLIDRPAHCARLGNARSLSYVAIDVYCELAKKFGGDVLTVKQALETNYDPKENLA